LPRKPQITVYLLPRLGSARSRHPAGGSLARCAIRVALCSAVIISGFSGCAILRRRGKTDEQVAAARELSQQGASALENGQNQQAELLLQQALNSSPDDASTHRYLAEALWRRGAHREALAQIAEAVRLDSKNANLSVRAGEMSLASGAAEVSLAHAEHAIRLDPKLAAAWALRGRVFWQLNQHDRALADLERSLEFSPDNSEVMMNIATIYRQRGQASRCLTTLNHLLDTCPTGEEPQAALAMQGVTLLEMNRPQQAVEALIAATRRGPDSAELFFQLARAQTAAGRMDEAAAAARRALSVDASHQPSRQLLAQLAAHDVPAELQRR
jgi:tetratricopeptide (TPR) repeat protein